VRQVKTKEDFAEIKAMGWSGCMHDSDCACSDATQERDRRILNDWAQRPRRRRRTPAKPKPDRTLLDGESMMIQTPHGLVWISALVGTSVVVYDNPEHNPVAMINLPSHA